MCRFIAYIGKPIIVDDILYKPRHSLIKQSYQAREMEEPLNGDGFGLAWYAHEIDLEPVLFTSVQPVWSNRNLMSLAPKIRTDCFFGHVRAASKGGVSEFNCHPFQYKRLLFMHNGTIENFERIKRILRRELTDEYYDWIKGQTDSEHFFALWLDLLDKRNVQANSQIYGEVMEEALEKLESYKKMLGLSGVTYINGVLTDGRTIVAVRYVSDEEYKASTLYYAAGREYALRNELLHIIPSEDGNNTAVLIVSEKLDTYKGEWNEVPTNHLITVSENLDVNIRPLRKPSL